MDRALTAAPPRLRGRRLGAFGRLLLWLCAPFFRRMALDAGPAAMLHGPVIYVLRAFSRLERLYIEWAMRTRRLRPGPVVFLRPRGPELEALALARPENTVVPVLVIWGRPAVRTGQPGEDEEPPTVRLLRRGSSVRVGAPLPVSAFLAEHTGEREEVLSRRLRWEISGRIERERSVVLGPPRKRARRLIREIMRSRRLIAEAGEIGAREGIPPDELRERVARYLKEIAADIRAWVLRLMRPMLGYVWNRIYDGIDIDRAGLDKVREAARKGPLILCPSHKSHIDYLVLSYVFNVEGLAVPHIAAGANLSFWPLGFLFRRGGAFFLRRTFKGNALYAATFRAYVRKLVEERVAIEFFIEGGRSRTGKLLGPKLGLLGMICDAAKGRGERRPQVVPISILYEKVIEEKSYADELGGGEKKEESVGGLLGARKVLTRRYGRVDIQFDEPFDLIDALGDTTDERAMRAAVRRVSHRIMYGITRAIAVGPSSLWAAALLAPGTRGVSREQAEKSMALLEQRARRAGARFPAPFEHDRAAALARAFDLFTSGRDVSVKDDLIVVPEDRRSRLDYYKNNSLNWWVAEAVLAMAARSLGGNGALEELHARTLELSRLLKLEFVYRVGATFETIFTETLAGMVDAGWFTKEGTITEAGKEPAALLAGLVRNFVETYGAAAQAIAKMTRPTPQKELLKSAMETAERMFLQGQLSRREAVSKTTLGNAIDYFKESEMLVEVSGKLELARPKDAQTLVDRIKILLA